MTNTTLSKRILTLLVFMLSLIGNAQVAGTHFTVTLANVTSTSNTMDFDILLTIDGTADAATGVKLSAMSAGVNYNTAIVNGGTLSCAYLGGKSAQISGLVNTVTPSTVTAGHIRITASPLTIENSFDVVNGTYTFGRYRLTNTASWASNSDAQLWLQPNNIGKTNTAVNAFPYGASAGASYSYSTTAPVGTPGVSLGYTQAAPLTAMLNAVVQDCATVGSASVTGVTCFGGADGSAIITMSALTPSVSAISYTIDGGGSQNATLVAGAFTIIGLSAGTYSVVVSNAGCPDVTVPVIITGPADPLTNVTTESACDSFTWPVTGLTYTTSGTHTGTTTNGNGCTVNETLNLTVTPITTNTTTITACGTYTWPENGTTYIASGTYTSVTGCNTETLELTITPVTTNTTTITACGTYTWPENGTTYIASGTYTSVTGCNTETLELTITPITTNTTTITACGTYTWPENGTTYIASGTYTSVTGCNTETLELTITPITTNTTTITACGTYTWPVNGTTYIASGTYTSVTGCNTETLELTITPVTTNTTTITACGTYTWPVNGTTYIASGTYTSVTGCNTETLDLTITPVTTNTTTITACGTYTWPENGTTYIASGTYTSVTGCNTETLELTITPITTNTTTITACGTYTWPVNGTTYIASGTYTLVTGCNTETLELTITPVTTNTTTITACDTYTWSVNSTAYTASGTYTSVTGCHTETLVLTINSAATPTGDAVQTISVADLNDATLEDLVVSPIDVIWYASLADAQGQINALPITTVLTSGSIYYAVNVLSGCPSLPFGVTVTVALGTNDFANANFSFYPNPTSGILNISYTDEITNVSVINMIGQLIMERKTNRNEVQIDLSSLPSSTYFVKVESTNGNSKVVKIIKRD